MLTKEQIKCEKKSEQEYCVDISIDYMLVLLVATKQGVIFIRRHMQRSFIPCFFIRNSVKHRHKTRGSFLNSTLFAPLGKTFVFHNKYRILRTYIFIAVVLVTAS